MEIHLIKSSLYGDSHWLTDVSQDDCKQLMLEESQPDEKHSLTPWVEMHISQTSCKLSHFSLTVSWLSDHLQVETWPMQIQTPCLQQNENHQQTRVRVERANKQQNMSTMTAGSMNSADWHIQSELGKHSHSHNQNSFVKQHGYIQSEWVKQHDHIQSEWVKQHGDGGNLR